MAVTFGNQPCLNPMEIVEQCRDQGLDTSWFGKPNSFRCPIGPDSGIGWLLLSLQSLAALQPSTHWMQPLQAPTNVQAYAGPQGEQITLLWETVPGAIGYNIYQANAPGQEPATPTLQGIVSNSVVIPGLIDATTYYFQVTAITPVAASASPAGVPATFESPKSAEAVATTQATPSPVPPTNFAAFATQDAKGNTQVTLNWRAVPGAASYNIYRRLGVSGSSSTPTIIGSGGPDFSPEIVPTAQDKKPLISGILANQVIDNNATPPVPPATQGQGMGPGQVYFYQVTTVDGSGKESARSAEIFVVTWPANVFDQTGDLEGSFINPSNPKQDSSQLLIPPPLPAPAAPAASPAIPAAPSSTVTPLLANAQVNLNRSYDLTFNDLANKPVIYRNIRIVTIRCLTPGAPLDPQAVYFVTICDRRRLFYFANKLLKRNYNQVVQPLPSVTIIDSSLEEFGLGSTLATLVTSSYASAADAAGNLVETWVTVRQGRLRDIVTNWKEAADTVIQAVVNLLAVTEIGPTTFYGYEYTVRTLVTFPNGDTNDTTVQAIPLCFPSIEADLAFVQANIGPLIGFKKDFTTSRVDPVNGQKTVTEVKTLDPTQAYLFPFDLVHEVSFEALNPHAITTTITIYKAGQGQTGLAGQIYDNGSLQANPAGFQLWSWDGMLGDIWSTVGSDFVGTWPGLKGLGFAPTNNPQNITIQQKPAIWAALALLARMGATIALDPIKDQFRVVVPGAPDTSETAAETKWESAKLVEDYSFEPDWNHIPQAVEVLFAKQGFGSKPVPANQDPWWHVVLKDSTALARQGVAAGATTIKVWEPQLQAMLDATQLTISNWPDVQARANAWASYVFTNLHRQQARTHKTYGGYGAANEPGFAPGNQIRAINVEDRGGDVDNENSGPRVEVVRGPLLGNQYPWDSGAMPGLGDYQGWGGSVGWASGWGWNWGGWAWAGPGALSWFGFPEQQWGWGQPQEIQ